MKAVIFCLFSLVTVMSVRAYAQAETSTSLCELAKHGRQMNGRQVRLTAVFTTDLLEYSSLNDRNCPKLYLTPYDAQNVPQDSSLDTFDKAVEGRVYDPELRQFFIDVSGKFVWQTAEKPNGALVFEKIWNFKRIHGDRKAAK